MFIFESFGSSVIPISWDSHASIFSNCSKTLHHFELQRIAHSHKSWILQNGGAASSGVEAKPPLRIQIDCVFFPSYKAVMINYWKVDGNCVLLFPHGNWWYGVKAKPDIFGSLQLRICNQCRYIRKTNLDFSIFSVSRLNQLRAWFVCWNLV